VRNRASERRYRGNNASCQGSGGPGVRLTKKPELLLSVVVKRQSIHYSHQVKPFLESTLGIILVRGKGVGRKNYQGGGNGKKDRKVAKNSKKNTEK